MVNLLLGSYDSKETKSWIDYLGSHTAGMHSAVRSSQVRCSLLDRYHRSSMTVPEEVEVLERHRYYKL